MLKKFKTLLLVILVILVTCSVSFNIYASNYPEKNVEIIVVFSAGGGTDVMVRLIASELEERLGGRFLVINKPGAGGEIGWTAASLAKADGYTLCALNSPNLPLTYILRPDSTKYRLEDFTLLVNMVTDPGVLVVSSDSPFKTLKEYINYAKENPGAITCSRGSWGDDYLCFLATEKEADIKLTGVQFENAGIIRAAILGGHISSACLNASEVSSYVENGTMRVLAVASDERSPGLPDVPTFKEEGYNVISGSARGIAAPKGIPEEVRNILIDTLTEIANSPKFIQKMKNFNLYIDLVTGEEYYKYLKTLETKAGETLKELLDD